MKLIYKIIDWILLTIILIILILTYLRIPPKEYFEFEKEKTLAEKLRESFKEEKQFATPEDVERLFKEFEERKTLFDKEESQTEHNYWINSKSNVRHNPSCRWYGNTKKGYYTKKKIGKACGICGG